MTINENGNGTSECYFRCSINQHKLIGALRHALKVLNEGQYGAVLLTNIDASGMVNFVAKAVRKSTLSKSARKRKLKQVGRPFWEVIYRNENVITISLDIMLYSYVCCFQCS